MREKRRVLKNYNLLRDNYIPSNLSRFNLTGLDKKNEWTT